MASGRSARPSAPHSRPVGTTSSPSTSGARRIVLTICLSIWGDADQLRAAAAALLAGPGRCDVFVHAAADLTQATLAGIDWTIWRRVQAVNVEAPLLLVQAPTPRPRRGRRHLRGPLD